MIISILKQYLIELWKNKFYSILALLGISITIMIIMVTELKYQKQWHPGGPEKHNDNFMYLTRTNIYNEQYQQFGGINIRLIDKYFHNLKTPIATSWSTEGKWTILGEYEVEDYACLYVNSGFWDVFDFELIKGRYFTKEEVSNQAHVIVVSENNSIRLTGKENAVGETIEYDGKAYKIIGVVKEVNPVCSFSYAQVWLPYSLNKFYSIQIEKPGAYDVVFKLDDNKKRAALDQEIRKIEHEISILMTENEEYYLHGPFDNQDIVFSRYGNVKSYQGKGHEIRSLLLKGLLILLIPALNLIGLNFMRIKERAEELSLRKALGASRIKIMKQIIFENLILSFMGGLLGLVFAFIGLKIFSVYLLNFHFYDHLIHEVSLDFSYISFFICLFFSAVLSVLSGIFPAWKLSKIQPAEILKGGEL